MGFTLKLFMKNISILLSILFCSINVNAQKVVNAGSANGAIIDPIYNSKVISLKSSGILSDAVLSFESSTFGTNQTSAIQAILNTASLSNTLYIIWDCAVSVTGLKIKSNTHIFALPNCGAILRDNSDKYLLGNYNYAPNNNSISLDSNIVIEGGIWNGNGYRSNVAKQSRSTATDGYMTVFQFSGVKRVKLLRATFLNGTTYSGMFLTSEDIYIDGVIVDQGAPTVAKINQDGIDFIGYTKNITVKNTWLRTGDDRFALVPNALGGNPADNHAEIYTGIDGDMDNMTFENITFAGYGLGFAIYMGGANKFNNLHINNVKGSCSQNWFKMYNKDYLNTNGYTISEGSEIAHNIVVENVTVEVNSYRPLGSILDPLIRLSCSTDNIVFRNIRRDSFALVQPTFEVTPSSVSNPTGVVISNLTIDGYTSINQLPGTVDNLIHVDLNTSVAKLTLTNSNIDLGTTAKNIALLKSRGGVTYLFANNNRINGLRYGFYNEAYYLNTSVINNTIHTNSGNYATIYNGGGMQKLAVTNWIGYLLMQNTGALTTFVNASTIGTVQ